MKLIQFTASSQVVTKSGSVQSNCNGVLFINLGASVCTILNFPLQQGQQLAVPCNVGEYDQTNYNVQFDANADKKLLVIFKNYNNSL